MPSERRGTVTEDLAEYIRRLSGSAEWRGDKAGAIRMPVGKVMIIFTVSQYVVVLNLPSDVFPCRGCGEEF